jgi:hypothetical protein
MGRAARRPGPPSFLFGVWGEGETSPENIEALLSEHIEGLGDITPRFVIPCDKEITTDTHLAVFEFAEQNKYAVEVVLAAQPRVKSLREMRDYAEKVHEADDGDNPIEKVFADTLGSKAPDNAQLLFLWAEEDGEPIEDDQRVLFDCLDQNVVALDLTQGLDALGAEDGADGGDEGGDDNADGGKDEKPGDGDEPDEATVREWPIRRLRKHAQDVAEARAEAGEPDIPSEEEVDNMGKNELLDFLYPSDPEAEPEKPARGRRGSKSTEAKPEPEDEGKGVTPRRARQMREQSEAEGTDSTSRNRRAAAKKTAQAAPDEPEAGGEGDDGGETASDAMERFIEGIVELGQLADSGDEVDDAIKDAIATVADAFADIIIDRIAARVEKEPEDSVIRQEVAPKRPPGKPRKDGATPTRRRTRA